MEAQARSCIQSWLQDLLDAEVTEFLGRGKSQRRAELKQTRLGYRNGYSKPRKVALIAGTITVRRPRVRDLAERFESRVLPLLKRRSVELGSLLPRLYLHGLSTGDFELALRGLLGEGAPLSASSMQRLKGIWQAEYGDWKRADLSQLELVYWWADGLYVKAGIAERKPALLVIVAATADDEKVLLACQAGERESKESWLSVLLGLKANALPKHAQPEAAERLRAVMYAESRSACERKRNEFLLRFKKADPKHVRRCCATGSGW